MHGTQELSWYGWLPFSAADMSLVSTHRQQHHARYAAAFVVRMPPVFCRGNSTSHAPEKKKNTNLPYMQLPGFKRNSWKQQQLYVVGVIIRGAKFSQAHLLTTSTYRQSELLHDGHVIGHLPPGATHTWCWVVGPYRQTLRKKVQPRPWLLASDEGTLAHARGVNLLQTHDTRNLPRSPHIRI